LGARTSTVEKLWFDKSVTQKIKWNFPGRAILLDLDGTLTGKGTNSWATPYFKHNEQPECVKDKDDKPYSLFCTSDVQVRKLSFEGLSPDSRFKMQGMSILKYDKGQLLAGGDDYVKNWDNYTWYPYLKPGWTVPFVTGHKYRIGWGRNGLDWDAM
jgi:hypothetical protein